MTDEVELGPDANDVRRHAKKLYTELEYRQRYCRIDFYKPNRAQLEFHNTVAREAALRAGNQLGKTTAGSAQMVFDSLGMYPDWYEGRRFLQPPKIERPYGFIGWAASTTSTTTRDGAQTKLFGDVRQSGGLGTGLLPLDSIVGRPTMARGISDFIDSAILRREVGGSAIIRLKTFEMDRQAYQGESVDVILIDEDPGDDNIWNECLARIVATDGRIILTATPVPGRTPIFKRFLARVPGTAEIRLRLADADHIPPERRPEIAAQYNDRERATRVDGEFMMGAGCVFEIPEEAIRHSQDPSTFPVYWPWLWGVDFSHAGMSASAHPFAAVLGCHDRGTDTIYIIHCMKLFRMLPQQHVAMVQKHLCSDAPVAWPHDGNIRGLESGQTIRNTYNKLGLNMLGSHATLPGTTKYDFEGGIRLMEDRLATNRLRVAAHLTEWFDEYRNYHRKDNLVVKEDDDLMSATRVLVMDIRRAQELGPRGEPGHHGFDFRRPQQRYAKGTSLNQPFDLFTGRPF